MVGTIRLHVSPRSAPLGRLTTIAVLPTRRWTSQIHGWAGVRRDVASPRPETDRHPVAADAGVLVQLVDRRTDAASAAVRARAKSHQKPQSTILHWSTVTKGSVYSRPH